MKLIVDSGSTKATWLWMGDDVEDIVVESVGINPVRDDAEHIRLVVDGVAATIASMEAVRRAPMEKPSDALTICFYGAGCIPPYSDVVGEVLTSRFEGAHVTVESDLLGAARALFGVKEGIACILGTGSNSCIYDGRFIVANVSPLGWILGDEGSGAVLGRMLVGDLLKGQLSSALRDAFLERFELTPSAIIDRVYRQPMPNRFLASLVPFIAEHRSDEGIHAFLTDAFRSFFRRNVEVYGRKELPVGFVGGIAAQFEEELTEVAHSEGFEVERVEKQPIHAMAAFHRMG